jgi:hypothetical protein
VLSAELRLAQHHHQQHQQQHQQQAKFSHINGKESDNGVVDKLDDTDSILCIVYTGIISN